MDYELRVKDWVPLFGILNYMERNEIDDGLGNKIIGGEAWRRTLRLAAGNYCFYVACAVPFIYEDLEKLLGKF